MAALDHRNDTRWVAHCARCDVVLTRAAMALTGSPSPLIARDGADGLPAGVCFTVATDDVWNGAHNGSLVVHHGDVRDMQACGDRSGCCGPSGTGGANLACANGHVVATEVADCWTPRFVFFAPEAITLRVDPEPRDDVVVHRYDARDARDAWPFVTWLHEALAAEDWFGADVGALARAWLASHPGACTIVMADSAGARERGVPVDALVDRIAQIAQLGQAHGSKAGRLVLVLA